VSWFLKGTIFLAKRKDELSVSIPLNSRFTVHINGQKQAKPFNGILNKNSMLKIGLSQEDDTYEIVLGENMGFDSYGPSGGDFYGGTTGQFGGGGGRSGSNNNYDDFDIV
jgi:hypothetical protein